MSRSIKTPPSPYCDMCPQNTTSQPPPNPSYACHLLSLPSSLFFILRIQMHCRAASTPPSSPASSMHLYHRPTPSRRYTTRRTRRHRHRSRGCPHAAEVEWSDGEAKSSDRNVDSSSAEIDSAPMSQNRWLRWWQQHRSTGARTKNT